MKTLRFYYKQENSVPTPGHPAAYAPTASAASTCLRSVEGSQAVELLTPDGGEYPGSKEVGHHPPRALVCRVVPLHRTLRPGSKGAHSANAIWGSVGL